VLSVLRESRRRTETVEFCAAAVPGKPANKASAPRETDVKNLFIPPSEALATIACGIISLERTAAMGNRTVPMG
jgi:hypothetical protein